MTPSIDDTLLGVVRAKLFTEYPGQVAACVRALDDDDLWWRPHEQANAVGNLLLHLTGSNRFHVEHVVGGAPDHRDRDAEFAARGGVPRTELLRQWDAGLARMVPVIDGLTPARLLERAGAAGRGRTVAEVLLHVTHHNALHVGQIVWVTKLRRPGALDELP